MHVIPLLLMCAISTAVYSAHAGEPPWYDNEEECHQAWFNKWNGCRIRREERVKELAQLPAHTFAANSKKSSLLPILQDVQSQVERLDEKYQERKELFIPHLKHTVELCEEIKSTLLTEVVVELNRSQNIFSYLQKIAISTPTVAALTTLTNDPTSISLALLHWKNEPETESVDFIGTKSLEESTDISINNILLQIGYNLQSISDSMAKTSGSVANLLATNKLMLESEETNLEVIHSQYLNAHIKQLQLKTQFDDTSKELDRLIKDQTRLPAEVASEEACQAEAVEYWANANKCASHHFQRARRAAGLSGMDRKER